jgi:hypothetical protein
VNASQLRQYRDMLLLAARDARYRPGRQEEVPIYVSRAKRLHRQLLRLQRVGP